MDHDVPIALAPVGPTVLVVAELLLGVHAALLLLTSYTSKDVAEIRFSFNSPFVHGCLGRYHPPRDINKFLHFRAILGYAAEL